MNIKTTMTTIYSKLASAKAQISQTKMEKLWNGYGYKYFTPEQVNMLVQKACEDNKLVTLFSLKRNEYWEYGVLKLVDTENGESLEIECATEIPEIKWTTKAQQYWGCLTYCERYLKQSLLWISDNSLDLDFQQSEVNKKADGSKSWVSSWATSKESSKDNTQVNKAEDEKPRFNKENLDKFVPIAKQYKTADDALKEIRSYYKISKDNEWKIRKLYENLEVINEQ